MDALRSTVLVAATVAMGLFAGLFYTYAMSVMVGLARADDRTFVTAMQWFNATITNAWFALSFVGAGVLSVVAVLLHLGADRRAVLLWIVAAVVLYGATIGVTVIVNIPLNDALAAAGDPDRVTDLAAVRERFEARWVRWNVGRTVLATAALGCLCVALRLS